MSQMQLTWKQWGGVALLPAVLGLPGCARQTPAAHRPPQVNSQDAIMRDAELRARELSSHAAELSALAANLPGNSADEDRRLMQQVFASLVQVLPLVRGANHGGVFDHQLSVVNDTRTQLGSTSPNLSIQPIVDNGLRALRNALDDAVHSGYADDGQISKLTDELASRVDELDSAHGATHSVVAAEVVGLATQVIHRMADDLQMRLNEPGAAATEPTTAKTEGSRQ
jgi:hypothetical protein